ncbi:uncharacterized protein DFL_006819 [Arthrobotrys flagrans]|uniref:Uncharacterized protein n=1 Tax=Arthrobotrys flagrans TaxID=97331 RepID=A0A436ZUF5_ARTFL|nr:hypothetical protein DFL_006819 [Arthrobotrys flagrans]
MANTYGQNLVQQLCKDLGANYMEFNFEDLDKLGLEFYRQHKAEGEAAREAEKAEKAARELEETKDEGDNGKAEATEGDKVDEGSDDNIKNKDNEANDDGSPKIKDDDDGEPDAENAVDLAKAKKKTGTTQINYLPESITNSQEWKEKEGSLNRGLNMKALKETLQKHYSYLVDETVVGGEVEWKLEGMEKVSSIISRKQMDSDELDRIAKSIATRTWGKPKIDLKDISEV